MIRPAPVVFRVSVIVAGLQPPGCVIIHKCLGMVDISPLKWTQDSENKYLNCVFNEVYQEHLECWGKAQRLAIDEAGGGGVWVHFLFKSRRNLKAVVCVCGGGDISRPKLPPYSLTS